MNRQSSRTSLFLIELVLSIFFFIIAAVICLQLFVNTFFLSRKTIETNQSLLWSQNLAEPFLGNNGDFSIVKKLYANIDCISKLSIASNDSILLCFDKDWNTVTELAESEYIVFSDFHNDDSFAYQDIYIAKYSKLLPSVQTSQDLSTLLCEDDYLIYQLSVKKFIP